MSSRVIIASLVIGLVAIGATAQQLTPTAPKNVPSKPSAAPSPKQEAASPSAEARIAAIEELAAKLLKETQALKAELKAAKKPAEASGDFSIYRLRFADASQMARVISATFDAADDKSLRIVCEPATNSVLVRGTHEQLKAIEAILMRLDVENASEVTVRSEFIIIELKHAEAVETVKLLKELLPQKNNSNMRLVADYRTNSILVFASPEEIALIKKVIIPIDEHATAPKKVRTTTPDAFSK